MSRVWFADSSVAWREGSTEGVRFRCQVLLSDETGGPEAFRFRFEPTPSVYAHMHLTSQFQVLLAGEMNMPRGRMDLRPLCVHYTDHNVPYGPFSTGRGHDMLVLHPHPGGLVPMAEASARRHINLDGRLVVASPDDENWTQASGADGRRKVLMKRGDNLRAELIEAPSGTALAAPAPSYGRYDVVIEGEVTSEGRSMTATGLRYALGDEPVASLTVTSASATIMTLAFDADAARGGAGHSLAPATADAGI